jgi:hypothetical protein
MPSEGSKSRPGSEFDRFLFACIGEDRNGLPLSVVSLLGRMNLDPWQEAAHLAGLPAEAAATRFAHSLDTLKDPVLREASSRTLVLRLLALLPGKVRAVIQTPAAATDDVAVTTPNRVTRIGTYVFVACVLAWMGSRFFAANLETPAQPGIVQTPGASTSAAPTTQPNQQH